MAECKQKDGELIMFYSLSGSFGSYILPESLQETNLSKYDVYVKHAWRCRTVSALDSIL